MIAIGTAAIALGYAVALFIAQGFWRDDVTLFSRCVEQAPAVAFWHKRLAMALAVRGDLAGASRELEAAVALEPDDGKTLYDLGRMYDRLGDHRGAERKMADGLKLQTSPPAGGYAELALVADAAADREGAEAALKRAAAIPGGGAETAALVRAQLRMRHGDLKGAEVQLRELLRRDPDNAQTLTVLGSVLSAGHRDGDAVETYLRAARVAPPEPFIHYLIAAGLHGLGREREAQKECAIAIAGEPHDASARALMAAIERSIGAP